MTARTQWASGVTEIKTSTDHPTKEVEEYIKELTEAGHEITEGRCHKCHKEFRVYWPLSGQVTVYSDFQDGEQCPFRQMNIIGGENAQ